MIKLRLDPPGLQLYQEMCYRKHTREMCPNLHKLLQGFGMQVAESLMLKISKEKKNGKESDSVVQKNYSM